ncbi:MAG: methenyltetrahydromethanopterin cyclohydrolase [Anaerolineae bacterium]|nr:methenyltetrahydromethanopterin cyclohydrolase [Anaerolineae bacterium]
MISINQQAVKIINQMIANYEALVVNVIRLPNGAAVIDAGIEVDGSYEAGILFAEACMGGLGAVEITRLSYDDPTSRAFWLPAVKVSVSSPSIACAAGQYAGWPIKVEGFFAMGSGPARALYAAEEIFKEIDYQDRSDVAVLLLEGRDMPTEEIAAFVAGKCGVSTENLTLVVAPTASLVGSIQVAARVVETGLHKMVALRFDIRQAVAAVGFCPLAPVAADDLRAIGRTNDAVLYGGQVFFTMKSDDEALSELVGKMPSSSSQSFGKLFVDILKECGGDFYQIDPMLFSPAEVTLNNLNSGKVFSAGQVDPALLRASLLEG